MPAPSSPYLCGDIEGSWLHHWLPRPCWVPNFLLPALLFWGHPSEVIGGQPYGLYHLGALLLKVIIRRPGVLEKDLQRGLSTTVENGECGTPPIAGRLELMERRIVPVGQLQVKIGGPL